MGLLNTLASTLATASIATVLAGDPGAKIDKPLMQQNLDYLKPGLIDNLQETHFTYELQAPGTIPEGCYNIATGKVESSITFPPSDFDIFNVHYDDCGDPWVFCHHKQSPITIDSMARQFSKLPIQMRQWVRHVVDVPSPSGGWAFELDGTVTFVDPKDDMLPVIIHETGHSLDLSGAYVDKPLSSSDKWFSELALSAKVPDSYSSTNSIEDVAQNTVISVFNENVPGGFGGIEPDYESINHQYYTLISEAIAVGEGNNLFKPGMNESCVHRMPPSKPVNLDGSEVSGAQRRSMRRGRGAAPVVGLSEGVKAIVTRREGEKRSECGMRW